MHLTWTDHRSDPSAWARALGISREAVELFLGSEVIDLHVDSFLWTRMLGYDVTRRHGRGLLGANFYSQVDLPRIREGGIGGATWVITTNPFRSEATRPQVFLRNLQRLRSSLEAFPSDVAVVRNLPEYRAARAAGKHAVFFGIQGGNALDRPGAVDLIPDDLIIRITLLHLTNSSLGTTSRPRGNRGVDGGLTDRGRDFVRALNAHKIGVDLAHISRKGFFDALAVHDRTQPAIVTHTGISGVFPHWRNLDDEQVRAVANTGGTIGIMFESRFLGRSLFHAPFDQVVDHMDHVIALTGDDCCSVGSDWDGGIVTPREMKTCLELPRLVQVMLDRRWPIERIQKVLGGNFLRVIGALRGTGPRA